MSGSTRVPATCYHHPFLLFSAPTDSSCNGEFIVSLLVAPLGSLAVRIFGPCPLPSSLHLRPCSSTLRSKRCHRLPRKLLRMAFITALPQAGLPAPGLGLISLHLLPRQLASLLRPRSRLPPGHLRSPLLFPRLLSPGPLSHLINHLVASTRPSAEPVQSSLGARAVFCHLVCLC